MPKIASLNVLLAFDRREVATLISVIEELILPGTTIVSGKLEVDNYILLPRPPPPKFDPISYSWLILQTAGVQTTP